MRPFAHIAVLLCACVAPAQAEAPFHEPNAVLVNITEEDLNRIVRDAFHAHGAASIEGSRDRLSRGITDFSYRAGFSDPLLRLGDDGRARLELDIREAALSFGRIERKLLTRRMACENAGVRVEPGRPVAVALDLRFVVDEHDLRIVPEGVTLANTGGFRLEKPTRCRNNPLPEFLLWWIGKGHLRRKIERMDDVLLAKARAGAEALHEDEALLARHWRIGDGQDDLHLYPQLVDTSHGSLLIGLAGSSGVPRAAAVAGPLWVGSHATRSFLGFSESLLNHVLRTAFRELDGRPRKPSGGLRKLFRGDVVQVLIPGLRGMRTREALRLGFQFHAPPRIELDSTADGRAMIRIRLSAVELVVWEAHESGQRWLGSVDVDEATLAVVPYHNPLGGVSLEIVDNDWRLSSRGIEFDEEILAATFQEIVFGETFETRYEPVGRESFDVGTTRFDPRYFKRIGNYLVIGLSGLGVPDVVSQANR